MAKNKKDIENIEDTENVNVKDIEITDEEEIGEVSEENIEKEKPKKKHNILKGILYTLLMLMFFGIIAACIGAVAFFIYIASNAPAFDESKLYKTEPSVIYDVDGNVIANIGTEDRVLLTYDELPEVLVNAIVATEDSRFFQHNGVDLPRFLKASIQQVMGGDGGGASTLTMQISKNIYTSKEAAGWDGIVRKFKDVYMAVFKIEPSYSKEQIVEFYVNSFYLGNGYGVEVTSKNYFGKSAKDLNVAEAALIAGLFQAPGAYNPYTNPEATETRRQRVLNLMLRHGYIDEEEYNIAKSMTVEKIVKENQSVDIASGIVNTDYQLFVDMVIQDVKAKTGESPYTKSMAIYTTMNPKMQQKISDIFNGKDKTYKWENKKVQGGVAIVDINTGSIAAIGGGRDVKTANTLNRAVNVTRQIGSTAKPLYDYGPAIEYLNWNTGTIINDAAYTYSNGTKITNADGGYTGYQTIETHLKKSRNIPALKTFQATSNEDKVKFVTGLGLAPEIYSCDEGYRLYRNKCISKENANNVVDAKITKSLHEAHAIGGYQGDTPLTMAAAYAAFANGGYYNEPYSFSKIVYSNGDTYINKTTTRQVMSDSTAYMITYMLQKTAEYGIDAGRFKNVNGVPYAAKTGTTNFDTATFKKYKLRSGAVNDLWVVGYNTEYSIGVWYGYDKIQDGTNVLSSQHQRLFNAVAKNVFSKKEDFKVPNSVVKVTTESDSATSLLPGKNTPSSYKTTSLFVSGTEPNKVSTRFDSLSDPTDLRANSNGDGTATISWSKIATPDAMNKSYIESFLNKKSFPGGTLSEYANYILGRNKSIFGEIGYNVYIEKNGTLELVGWTADDNYVVSASNGNHKVVVKSCYSKYKSNMSNGVTLTVNISGSAIEDHPTPTPETDNQNSNSNNNNNNETNNQP